MANTGNRGAIYTIGYARLKPARLLELVDLLAIDRVFDVRSSPRTRVAGFGPRQLETLLGPRYQWRGRTLGGRTPIADRTLSDLATETWAGARTLLMCMEESPGECHRHHDIGLPLAEDGKARVLHIYRDEILAAQDLQTAIDDGSGEYDFEGLAAHAREEEYRREKDRPNRE